MWIIVGLVVVCIIVIISVIIWYFMSASSTTQTVPPRTYQTLANTSYSTGYLPIDGVTGPSSNCQQVCDNTDQCMGFSVEEQTCRLRAGTPEIPTYMNGAQYYYTGTAPSAAAVAPASRSYQTLANTDYYMQGDIAGAPGTPAKCQSICDQTPKCSGFVTDGTTCWLKDNTVKTPNYVVGHTYYYTGTAPSVAATGPTPVWVPLSGADYSGNDLTSIPNSNVETCQTACASNSQCVGAVYGTDTNTCWLKSDLKNPSLSDNRVLYLQKGIGQVTGMDYGGNDLTSSASSGVSDCRTKCQNQSGCIGGEYVPSSNICWMKSKLSATSLGVDTVAV